MAGGGEGGGGGGGGGGGYVCKMNECNVLRWWEEGWGWGLCLQDE